MNRHYFCFLFFYFLFCVGHVSANEIRLSEKQEQQWQKLIHFRNGESAIESGSFFLSPNGRYDANAEFQATLTALNRPGTSVHCDFPARYLWMHRHFKLRGDLSLEQCIEYQTWRAKYNVNDISLVYVTGYMGNPASFFGHLLIKLNRADSPSHSYSSLLDSGVNFGAITPANVNPFVYVTKGLFGGYSAQFTLTEFYQFEQNYSELEQREIWEYPLNLTGWEVRFLEAHLWELQGKQYRYYFLDSNCATEIAHVLEIILDETLLPAIQPWDMPVDILNAMNKITHHGVPLMGSESKRDSKYTRVKHKYEMLTSQEKRLVQSIIRDITRLTGADFVELPELTKARVLDVLGEYYEYLIVTGSDSNKRKNRENKRQVMLAQLRFKHPEVIWGGAPASPPHTAQLPAKAGLSLGHNNAYGAFASMSGQAGYYDFLALENARFPDSAIVLFNTNLRFNKDKVWLQQLEVFNMSALNTHKNGLFDSNKLAWQISLAVKQHHLSCNDCLRTTMAGYMGKSYELGEQVSAYVMPGMELDLNYSDDSVAQLQFGALYTSHPYWKSRLVIMPEISLSGKHRQWQYTWENRFGRSQSWDIRLEIRHDQTTESLISYNLYY